MKEHARLEAEKPKVLGVARTARSVVGQYQYAQQRLERIKREMEEFESKYGQLFEPRLDDHIQSALQSLNAFTGLIEERRKLSISRVHVKLRTPKDESSGWVPLLKRHAYELESLHVRAVDQWLWQKLNGYIDQFKSSTGKKLSDMTKYKVISAVCRAAQIGACEPTAIKQYLLSAL